MGSKYVTGKQGLFAHQRATSVLLLGISSLLSSCGSSGTNPAAIPPTTPSVAPNVLTQADVSSVVLAAAASVNVPLVIAVSDRRGYILAIYHKAGAPAMATGNFGVSMSADEVAAGLARTAAFFSNDQAPIGSRTVRFLSGIHFPPGIMNVEAAPLYGIENTNRGCGFNVTYLPGQQLAKPEALSGGGPGPGIVTGKPDLLDSDAAVLNPGGLPIFKGGDAATQVQGRVGGGIGIVAADSANEGAIAEYAGVVATVGNGFGPGYVPPPGAVVVNGITLPFVNQTTLPAGVSAGAADGAFTFGPVSGVNPAPEGDLIAETGSTQGGLTLAQVQGIVQAAIATGNQTRAAIRLPVGSRARFVISVADLDGHLLALYRMPDATLFSVDVAVAKSRNVIYFSGDPATTDMPGVPTGTAVTNRTLGFAAQPFYPSGIDGTQPGPFYSSLFLNDVAHPCTQGSDPNNVANHNGIVFFPGSAPLYVNGKLVGGLGVSGDGVDQDDYAAAGGATGYEAAPAIRADQIIDRKVRLPFQKFPRNPTD